MARFLLVCLTLASSLPAADLRLLDAVKRRDPKAFDTLLQQHADINAAAPDGATALAWASFLDERAMAEKLIDQGAKVNTAGDYGETPLTLALANNDAGLAAKLLNAGADPKAARWNGETALMIAAGAGSAAEVKLLLDRGVDPNGAEPRNLQNALMWASSEGHVEVVGLLIERGAHVNAATKSGFTPLIFAALKNDSTVVKRLLAAGANANDGIPDGTKVLTIAESKRGHAAALALLDGGADPNVSDKDKKTPLHMAAEAGALDLVKKLIAKGAKVDARTGPGKEEEYRPASGEQTPLLLAARNNHVDVMRALIEAGADPKLKGQDGASLLLAASLSGCAPAAKYAYEFDKDVKAVDLRGRTAMHESVANPGSGATQAERTELVQYLAGIGVPLDEKDKRGHTPIEVGDPIPLDEPIQRMADLIVARGEKPKVFPKEYKKPVAAP